MNGSRRMILLVMTDAVSALLAMPAAHLIRFGRMPSAQGPGVRQLVVFMLVAVFVSFIIEIYKRHRDLGVKELAARIAIAAAMSFLIIYALSWLVPLVPYGSDTLALSLLLFGGLQLLTHAGYRICVKLHGLARKVLILGVGPLAGHMGTIIPSTDDNYILSGYVKCADETSHVPAESILGGTDGLYETVKREKADKIVVSLSERRGVFPLRDVMACKLDGIEVVDAPSFYEQMTGKLLLESITPSWFIFSEGFRVSAWRRAVKRTMDIICSTAGIILTLPFLPLIALAIKLDSPGPVFFRQERVGEREKGFTLYKFRTMGMDAEKGTGAVWAKKNDPRVTRVGEFFRKSRIDEIPQLYNVLRGDMSLIGPRPERPEFVRQLKEIVPYYSERHFVKPGVTGWAQVRYPYGASVEDALEKLRYDLYYIKNFSLALDPLIVLETIKVVLFRRGGR